MKVISWQEIAKKVKERADFELTDKQSKSFLKQAMGKTTNIIKNSKGKILVKNCDVQQFYKDINIEGLKHQLMDLNEVQKVYNKVRIY